MGMQEKQFMKVFTMNSLHRLYIRSVLALLLPWWLVAALFAQEADKKSTDDNLKITISKETTWFTAPLNEDGEVDYIEAANEYFSKGVTAENNFVVAALAVVGCNLEQDNARAELMRRLAINELPDSSDCLVDLNEFDSGEFLRKPLDEIYDEILSFPWSREEYKVAAEWIDRYSPMVDKYVDSLNKTNRYYYPLLKSNNDTGTVIEALNHLPALRMIARFLKARSFLRLHDGDIDGCQRDILAIRKTASLVCQGPSFVDQLIGYAIHSMAQHAEMQMCLHEKTTVMHLENYQIERDKISFRSNLGAVISDFERLMQLQTVWLIKDGRFPLFDTETTGISEPLGTTMFLAVRNYVDWEEVMRSANGQIDDIVKAIDHETYLQQLNALQEIFKLQTQGKPDGTKTLMTIMMATSRGEYKEKVTKVVVAAVEREYFSNLPGESLYEAYGTALTKDSLMRVNLALLRYQHDHGTFPDTLANLSPDYLKVVPADLFSNKPLNYKKIGKHYLLYSIGSNLVDDGGDTRSRNDIGITSDLERWNAENN
jgi:hypothetical protein